VIWGCSSTLFIILSAVSATVIALLKHFSLLFLFLFLSRSACTARYCCGKSVCPPVRHTLVLYWNECIYRQTLSSIW